MPRAEIAQYPLSEEGLVLSAITVGMTVRHGSGFSYDPTAAISFFLRACRLSLKTDAVAGGFFTAVFAFFGSRLFRF